MGNGSLVTFDFGKEVGGITTVTFQSSGSGGLGFAFTEARNFVGEWSDDSNGNFTGPDGALYTTLVPSNGSMTWTMPQEKLRGGFRYMTIFLVTNATATVSLESVDVQLDFQPTWPNLQAYQGYFSSSDDLLDRIWYAGAYTLQSNSVPTSTGRQVPFVGVGWDNNATLGPGDSIIVDGAKRDRAVWPGDMNIASASYFVSLGELSSIKNALQVMYDTQNKTTGAFAESGPPLSQQGSDTYHMWTMVGTYNYYLYTEDAAFLQQNWASYEHAMTYITNKIDDSGLLNVTGIRDWVRESHPLYFVVETCPENPKQRHRTDTPLQARWQQGFHNTEANTILYHTLLTGSQLAAWQGLTSLAANWTAMADSLAANINSKCFDVSYGAYRDNDTATTLHPQDANSMALLFGLAPSQDVASITSRLVENWTPIGPQTPELPYNICPFISSFELLGRFTVRDTARAFDLLRTTWGWIINNPNSTQSTLLEGYLVNGNFSYRYTRGYDYDASYTSHAHGWSSGPTSALTNYVVGLDVVEPLGHSWTLAPQMGDLTSVQGGFTTGLGKFSASWSNSSTLLSGTWLTPVGTAGVLTVPWKEGGQISVNGAAVSTAAMNFSMSVFGEKLFSTNIQGGAGTLTVTCP